MENMTLNHPEDLQGPETEAENHAEETRDAVMHAGHSERLDEHEASDGRLQAAGVK